MSQIIAPRSAHKRGGARPPANLVAQVARHLAGDNTTYRTDFPKPLMKDAERLMRAAHYPGLERRGTAWVKRTIERTRTRA